MLLFGPVWTMQKGQPGEAGLLLCVVTGIVVRLGPEGPPIYPSSLHQHVGA
jgi:hypothetical protein